MKWYVAEHPLRTCGKALTKICPKEDMHMSCIPAPIDATQTPEWAALVAH